MQGGGGVRGERPDRPGAKAGSNPWQEAFRQVHGVGHAYDCQAAALPHRPLKQVVQHLRGTQGHVSWYCLCWQDFAANVKQVFVHACNKQCLFSCLLQHACYGVILARQGAHSSC